MTRTLITGAAILGAAIMLTGCGDTGDQTSPPATNAAVDSVSRSVQAAAQDLRDTARTASTEAGKVADSAAGELKEAGKAVGQAVEDATAAAREKIDTLTSEVNRLIADGKGSEALQKLQASLSDLKLTPEQKQKIDELMAKAKDTLKDGAAAATQAIGGLVKPKLN